VDQTTFRGPPESPFPQSAVCKEKGKKHARNRPPIFASGAFTSYSCEEKRSKEILEWCLDGILLIPPANFRIFQEIQHRTSQPFILEKIHHLEPGPTLPPPLPAFPSLACDPLNPLFEGKLPCGTSAGGVKDTLILPLKI
jgi:hypothetical protein